MAWRGPRTASDPGLNSRAWLDVKAHWRAIREPRCQAPRCLHPRVPVDYDGPYWLYTRSGRRTINRYAFHAGHIVGREQARRLRWPADAIYCIGNSRPEHAACNISAGARRGQIIQARRREVNAAMNADRW